ncbi:MAG: hypothetical protein NG747_15775 [Candidatus Brocadia sp.]|nr:hypothetical protein [Candidatus Brocadia sp.]
MKMYKRASLSENTGGLHRERSIKRLRRWFYAESIDMISMNGGFAVALCKLRAGLNRAKKLIYDSNF